MLQELPDKLPISGKRKKKLSLHTEKKGKLKIKNFSKTTRVDELEHSVKSEQPEPEPCK